MTGYGHAAFGGGGGGNPFQGGGFGGQDVGDIFGDIFGEMFNMGGQRKASRVQRGRDLRYDLSLEFTEAVFGVEKEITIRRAETCEDLQGDRGGEGEGRRPRVRSARERGRCGISRVLFRGADVLAVQRNGDDCDRSLPDVRVGRRPWSMSTSCW